jgi:hypothetical protein
MKHFTNFFLLALCAALFINLMSCDKECPEPVDPNACNSNGTCNRGFECDNGTCKCPDDGMILNNHCVGFGGGGSAWKGLSSTCFCYDTLGFGILGTGENRTLSMAFAEGNLVGSGTTGAKYYSTPSGDSIYVAQMPIACARAGATNKVIPRMYGKVQPDGDLTLRLVFFDAVTRVDVDECVTTLRKIK